MEKARGNLATEILGQMKGKLIRCRIALVISTGHKCGISSNSGVSVTEIGERAAVHVPAALFQIIERRCLLWRKRGRTAGAGY